jgi:hypothetical protein
MIQRSAAVVHLSSNLSRQVIERDELTEQEANSPHEKVHSCRHLKGIRRRRRRRLSSTGFGELSGLQTRQILSSDGRA